MPDSLSKSRLLFQDSIKVKQAILSGDQLQQLPLMGELIIERIKNGGKVMFCGNGGSAADAQHLAAELLVRLRPHVNRQGVAALALSMDSSTLTACGNDFSFEAFYERMVETLGTSNDVLLGITTSGKSPNIVRALKVARKMGICTLGFLGDSGLPAIDHCDLSFLVPSNSTGRIQESHITAGHILLELVEDGLINCGYITLGEQKS